MSHERLRDVVIARGIRADLRVFDASCHSVAEAAAAAGAREDEFVKSICLVAEGGLVVAIVKGEDRASTTHVQEALGLAERPRVASAEEVLALSSYAPGGVPPFGFAAVFLVDERVMERAHVWAGGGSDRALVRIAPEEMLRANGGRVARIRK